jgi:hypothetical protein
MALSLYELTECLPGMRSAYLTHQKGAMMLLQLRGPEASASPLGQSLFLGFRTQTVSPFPAPNALTFTKQP